MQHYQPYLFTYKSLKLLSTMLTIQKNPTVTIYISLFTSSLIVSNHRVTIESNTYSTYVQINYKLSFTEPLLSNPDMFMFFTSQNATFTTAFSELKLLPTIYKSKNPTV